MAEAVIGLLIFAVLLVVLLIDSEPGETYQDAGSKRS